MVPRIFSRWARTRQHRGGPGTLNVRRRARLARLGTAYRVTGKTIIPRVRGIWVAMRSLSKAGRGTHGGAEGSATPENRFKVSHSALFHMWGVGHLGGKWSAFGAEMDGRRRGLSGFGTWLRAASGALRRMRSVQAWGYISTGVRRRQAEARGESMDDDRRSPGYADCSR